MFADLHLHSMYSDGTDTPDKLVSLALNNDIEVISISDHDTITAYKNFSWRNTEIKIIPAIEISTVPDKKGGRDSKSDVYKEEFLYNLENDPNEFNNLIQNPEYESIRAELQKILIENMQTAGEKIPVII